MVAIAAEFTANSVSLISLCCVSTSPEVILELGALNLFVGGKMTILFFKLQNLNRSESLVVSKDYFLQELQNLIREDSMRNS